MNVIEKHIHQHFARQAEESQSNASSIQLSSANDTSNIQLPPPVLTPPFAKVNSVVSGSPAETAGLKAEDKIRSFGYVNHTNHDGLKRVAECVQGNEGASYVLSAR